MAKPHTDWDAVLDALAAGVFGSPAGQRRLAPLLARWDDHVGPLREEDPEHPTWQAMRTDWALCDAAIDGPGDTWAWRVVTGRLDLDPVQTLSEVLAEDAPQPEHDRAAVHAAAALGHAARSIAGLWLVHPGRRPWMCDALSGIGLELGSPMRLDAPPHRSGDAIALWDARVVVAGGVAQLCRPPVAYPLDVVKEVRRVGLSRLSSGATSRHEVLMALRRRWLHWARAPRADARLLFAALEGPAGAGSARSGRAGAARAARGDRSARRRS